MLATTHARPQNPQAGPQIFVASPMDSLGTDTAFQIDREGVLRIVQALEQEMVEAKVHYAGSAIASRAAFDPELRGFEINCRALHTATAFVLLYPARIASSVLVEVGAALALELPIVMFVRSREDLPYLLRAFVETTARVRCFECATIDEAVAVVHLKGAGLFDFNIAV